MMPIEKQVVSLELSNKLKELGVKQDSLFYWMKYTNKKSGIDEWDLNGKGLRGPGKWHLIGEEKNGRSWNCDWDEQYSAFTVAELGEILKDRELPRYNQEYKKWLGKAPIEMDNFSLTEANARAKMLIYLLENSLMGKERG